MIKVEKYEKGLRVVRGPDWDWGMQDRDGEGTIIKEEASSPGWAVVEWGNGERNSYSIGGKGKYDLALAPSEIAKRDKKVNHVKNGVNVEEGCTFQVLPGVYISLGRMDTSIWHIISKVEDNGIVFFYVGHHLERIDITAIKNIKPPVPTKDEFNFVLPKKWCIKGSDKLANLYRSETNCSLTVSMNYYFPVGTWDSKNWTWTEQPLANGLTEITVEQFEKYVMNTTKPKYLDVKIGDTVWLHTNAVDKIGHIPNNQEGKVERCFEDYIRLAGHDYHIHKKYIQSIVATVEEIPTKESDTKGGTDFIGRLQAEHAREYLARNAEFALKYGIGGSLPKDAITWEGLTTEHHIGKLGTVLYPGTGNEYDKPLIMQRKKETKRKLIITK